MFVIMFDLDAEKPVELAKIGSLYVPGDLNLNISDQYNQCGHNYAVVNMDQDNNDSTPFSMEGNRLVDITSLEP